MPSLVRRFRQSAVLVCGLLFLIGATGKALAQSPSGGFDGGTNGSVLAIAIQADGKIVVGGTFTMLGGGGTGTTARNNIGRLNADGTVDATFNPGASGGVHSLAIQPDGRIVVGGSFNTLGGGGTGTTSVSNIARLNPDGSIDTSFNPGANGDVFALAVQPDGKILVGGQFTALGGGGTTPRNYIGRLNANGTVDEIFDPGASSSVRALAVQPDGKILAGGFFTMLGGGGTGTTARNRIGRLNANGTVDAAFNPGANALVLAIAEQVDGKILVGGTFTGLGGGTGTTTRNRIGRLNADGSVDATFAPGASDTVNSLAVQRDGKILVGGTFTGLGGGTGTTARQHIGRFTPTGALDTSFAPVVGFPGGYVYALAVQPDGRILAGGNLTFRRVHPDGTVETVFNPGANNAIIAIGVQPDGKVVVGGTFTMLGGGTGTTARARIGRLLPDGTVDPAFDPGADLNVLALAVQPDGKILVGGAFSTLAGVARSNLGRLNADGTIDAGFNPAPDSFVRAMVVQPDGRILVGGDFGNIAGGVRNYIARLNANGTLDGTFDPGANSTVQTLALTTSGDVLVGGSFTSIGGGGTGSTTRNRIARLSSSGVVDSFNPGANGTVRALAVQGDGKIVVGGDFTTLGGTTHLSIGRVLANGTVEDSFSPGAQASTVQALAIEVSGNIVVGGTFTQFSGHGTGPATRNNIARVDRDGSLDATFDPGANATVFGLAIQPDGQLLVVGNFTGLGGGAGTTARNRIGRLTEDKSLFQLFNVYSSSVSWLRAEAGPHFSRTTFERSADGTTYTALGSGTSDGSTGQDQWFVGGLSLPLNQNVYVRGRGVYASGLSSASESILEVVSLSYISSSLQAPAFGAPLVDQTVGVGAPVSFTAMASAGYPLPEYRWELSTDNGGSWTSVPAAAPYIGVRAATLYITGAPAPLNGVRYRAVAFNRAGAATSASARLKVSAAPSTQLVTNSTFSSGASGWLQFALPDASGMVSNNGAGGVFEFYRAGTQAVVFQQTGQPLDVASPVVASFDLGNSDNVRKRISVLLHDSDFSDLHVCTFWLPPNMPLTTYTMGTHTTKAWANTTISFYAASVNAPGNTTGLYRLDNVSVTYDPGNPADRTVCADPNAPTAPGGPSDPSVLVNGNFGSGTLAPGWSTFGNINGSVTGGVFQFNKLTSAAPAGVLLQPTGQAVAANQILTSDFQLGNSSSVRKRVTVLLHDNDFSDLAACTFWLPPGQPLSYYVINTYTTKAWTNATFSVYPATVGADQWILFDNAALNRTPATPTAGTSCFEPTPAGADASAVGATRSGTSGASGPQALMTTRGDDVTTDDRPATASAAADGTTEPLDGWIADGFARTGEPSPTSVEPSWVAASSETATHTLTRVVPIDVTTGRDVRLTFASWLSDEAARAEVQVSVDGTTWDTVYLVAPSDTWMPMSVDMSAYAGQSVFVRFVVTTNGPAGVAPGGWHLDIEDPGRAVVIASSIRPPILSTSGSAEGAVRRRMPGAQVEAGH